MTEDTAPDHLDALSDLLDAERQALLAGDLEALGGLLEEKEALIEAMNAARHHDTDGLRRLDSKVRRNQLLLNGALEGIRNVSNRVAELRKLRTSLETYDARGQKRSIELGVESAVEKRA